MKRQKLTNIIYALIMCFPFLSILFTCCYLTFNKNAELPQQETTKVVEHKPQTNEVNSEEDLIEGNWYKIEFTETMKEQNKAYLPCSELYFFDNYITNTNYLNYSTIANQYFIYNNEDLLIGAIEAVDTNLFYFKYLNESYIGGIGALPTYLTEEELALIPSTYETQTIVVQENANAFYYACNQVIEQPLFNWVTNTEIYDGFSYVNAQLGIANNFTNVVFTYWFIISIAYLCFDILMIFISLARNLILKFVDKGANV